MLADRAAAHVPLDDPGGVATLLLSLRGVGAHEQAAVLADRAAAHVPLDHPNGVATLLHHLRWMGYHEQATTLLDRDPAVHVSLDDLRGVSPLLDSLREADAHEQAATLTRRLPAAGMFELFLEQEGLADQFRFGREADGAPAVPWGWEDLDLWLVTAEPTSNISRAARRLG